MQCQLCTDRNLETPGEVELEADLCSLCSLEASTYRQEWFRLRDFDGYWRLMYRFEREILVCPTDPEYLVFLNLITRAGEYLGRGVKIWLSDRERVLLAPGSRIQDPKNPELYWHLTDSDNTGASTLFRFREKWWVSTTNEEPVSLFLDNNSLGSRRLERIVSNLLRLDLRQTMVIFEQDYPIKLVSGLRISEAENFARAFTLDSKVVLRIEK